MVYVIITIAALAAAALILLVIMLGDRKSRANSEQEYIKQLSSLYNDHSVIDSLVSIKDMFKKGSTEYIAIDKAIFYLTQSITRDYQTAFAIIEKVFTCNEVKNLHMAIMEQEKANIMYLLQ